DQVTTVAREVGVEGRLGGQAHVPGAAGTWRDLTDNLNQLAANLTTQVRAIGDVATAVTKGDLSRSIKVEASGEVEQLKDNLNEMISNLRETTQKNTEQDWLKTNLARFTSLLQGQKDLQTVGKLILSELAPLVQAQHGVFYVNESPNAEPLMKLLSSYAYRERKTLAQQFKAGEGLVGQCVYEKERILLTNVPDDYVEINSGLGAATPHNIVVLPVLFEDDIKAVIELASFNRFSDIHLTFLDQLTESIGIVLNTIAASGRTEELLTQSQALAGELQEQQEELQQTNEELEEKARLLSEQNEEVERRTRQIDDARAALEQKAEQLALTSTYKSQFLANMSHELRTPLNSLLILSQQLAENRDNNLSAKQVEFAQTIRAAGDDLLTLINDILDLAKIESGTVAVDVGEVLLAPLGEYLGRSFGQMAQQEGLEFSLELAPSLPSSISTDETRLQQVLKNLLSNAFKFTNQGRISLQIAPVTGGWNPEHRTLSRARGVVAFAVSDTGIGILPEKQALIFEAFQQANMDTSRKYGGTGLGLSISRQIADLLGGELRLVSTPGVGSTFTLYLPQRYQGEAVTTNGAGYGAELVGAALAASPIVAGSVALQDRPPVTPNGGAGPTILNFGAAAASAPAPVADVPSPAAEAVSDDRRSVGPHDRALLIVEDDASFGRILLDMARERGFQGLVASRGDEALELARQFQPLAITLDVQLPDMDGLKVLQRLKHDPATRHIPVHVISGQEQRHRALELGAVTQQQKPISMSDLTAAFDDLARFVDRPVRNLLVVEDDDGQRKAIVELIGNGDVKTTAV
ncbi:MAG: GAF domain-containing protein, partial [Chloroflexi bacterium]|nr:GAF domain-containing protein [Chloroflexota bacterium]